MPNETLEQKTQYEEVNGVLLDTQFKTIPYKGEISLFERLAELVQDREDCDYHRSYNRGDIGGSSEALWHRGGLNDIPAVRLRKISADESNKENSRLQKTFIPLTTYMKTPDILNINHDALRNVVEQYAPGFAQFLKSEHVICDEKELYDTIIDGMYPVWQIPQVDEKGRATDDFKLKGIFIDERPIESLLRNSVRSRDSIKNCWVYFEASRSKSSFKTEDLPFFQDYNGQEKYLPLEMLNGAIDPKMVDKQFKIEGTNVGVDRQSKQTRIYLVN